MDSIQDQWDRQRSVASYEWKVERGGNKWDTALNWNKMVNLKKHIFSINFLIIIRCDSNVYVSHGIRAQNVLDWKERRCFIRGGIGKGPHFTPLNGCRRLQGVDAGPICGIAAFSEWVHPSENPWNCFACIPAIPVANAIKLLQACIYKSVK